jgi:hypothetical protein
MAPVPVEPSLWKRRGLLGAGRHEGHIKRCPWRGGFWQREKERDSAGRSAHPPVPPQGARIWPWPADGTRMGSVQSYGRPAGGKGQCRSEERGIEGKDEHQILQATCGLREPTVLDAGKGPRGAKQPGAGGRG